MRQTFDPRTERVSGMRPGGHHVDERLAGVAFLEQRLEVDGGVA